MVARHLRIPVLLSLLAAVATVALKATSYRITDSVGLLSDLAESGVNLLAALTALLSLWYSSRPVDRTHTYGHEKIEYFSSGLEGTLILVAAGSIAYYAVHRLFAPEPLQQLDLGAGLTLLASLINLVVARILLRVGRAAQSIVLEADGQHLMADVWTSLGVVCGLAIVSLVHKVWDIDVQWLDSLIALGLAINISRTGLILIQRSFEGLMDHALPAEEQARVRAAIAARLLPGMDFHALRSRRAGSRRFVDFHLLVPGARSVFWAHEITGQIEAAVRAVLPGAEVTVHVEPIEERDSWEDSALVPLEQEARQAEIERQRGVPREPG